MPPHGWWNIQRAAPWWLLDLMNAHAGSVTFMQGLLVSRMRLQMMSQGNKFYDAFPEQGGAGIWFYAQYTEKAEG